jgi:tetratricopeptide (TPR) repeat protein
VALDDSLPDTHTSLGLVNLRLYWNWPMAEREFRRAIEVDADYAPAHYHYSTLLAIMGRFPEAMAQSKLARDLDPFSSAAKMNYCRTFYFARDEDRALQCFEDLVKENPDYKNHRYMLGLVYLSRGEYPEAIKTLGKLYEEEHRLAGSALGYAYGVAGLKGDALRVLSKMEQLQSGGSHIPPQEFAIIHMGLGDKEKAYAFLGQASAEHFGPLASLGVDPLFDSLRPDPRFADLLKTLNLSPPH